MDRSSVLANTFLDTHAVSDELLISAVHNLWVTHLFHVSMLTDSFVKTSMPLFKNTCGSDF